MKSLQRASVLLCALGLAGSIRAQSAPPAAAANFQINKITKSLVSTPYITYTGGQQFPAAPQNTRDLWLEIEVEFTSTAEYTDELTLKYFALINGKVLTGEVTHVNVPAGKTNRSVMYAPPTVVSRFSGVRPGAAISPAAIQNVAVQILQKGTVKDEASATRAPAQWYAAMTQVPGFLLNKNETPFASLNWDRYAQIKPAGR